jgi:hypothetical protein
VTSAIEPIQLPTPDRIRTHIIEIRKKPMSDTITARCLALRLKATSTSGHMCAVQACAKKVAMGRAYTLREFNSYTWMVDVNHAERDNS